MRGETDCRFADIRALILPRGRWWKTTRAIPYVKDRRMPTVRFVVGTHAALASVSNSPDARAATTKPIEETTNGGADSDLAAAPPAPAEPAKEQPVPAHPGHAPALGYHRVGTSSHVAKLSSARAAELLHRRCHLSLNKLRTLAHTTADAPKVLASAPAPLPCSHCVHATRITFFCN